MGENLLSSFCQKALLLLTSCIFLLLLVWQLANYSVAVKGLALLLFVMAVLVWIKRDRFDRFFTLKRCRLAAVLLILLAFGVQLFVAVTQSVYVTHGDVGVISTGAGEIEQFGHLVEDNRYFQIYPHQLFSVVFYGVLNRIFVLCGAEQVISPVASAVVNCVLISLGTWLLYLAVETTLGARAALMTTALVCFNVSYYTQVTALYAHTLSAVFSGFAVWCAATAFRAKERRAMWWLLCGGAFFAARAVEGILLIGFIALCIAVLFLRQSIRKKTTALAALLVGFLVAALLLNGFYRLSGVIDYTNAENERLPVTHWIMMGLSDSPDGQGIFSEDDYQTMVHLATAEEKKEYSLQQIAERLQSRTPTQLLALMGEKERRVWLGVIYGGALIDRDNFDVVVGQTMRLLLTLLVLWGTLRRLPQKKAGLPYWNVFLYSWLVGVFLFFLLWESSVIYLHSCQFLLVLAAVNAFCD